MINLHVAGIASCAGGNSDLCSLGPLSLKYSRHFHRILRERGIQLKWERIFHPDHRKTSEQIVRSIGQEVSNWTHRMVAARKPFVTFGGDHSAAMGIWRGAMQALGSGRKLGLIWIDAHLDLHHFGSSPSGNIHGMPVAALLGQSDERLAEIYGEGPILEPENIALLGARSFETEEEALVKELNLYCLPFLEIARHSSLADALQKAVARISQTSDAFGISLDLDALDPQFAPAVGTPAPGGFSAKELCQAFECINPASNFLGIEIAEYYPPFDRDQRTLKLIADLLSALYGKSKTPNRSFGSKGSGIRSISLPTRNSPESS